MNGGTPAGAAPAPARSRWPWSLAALLACIAVLRSAGFVYGLLNIDESDFTIIARRILQGAVPYAEIADIKPPLAYLAFIPGALSTHLSVLPMHLLGVLWLFATGLLLGRAAKLLTGSDLAAACAPWLTLLAALCDVPSVSTELLMALPLAGALYFYVRAEAGGGSRDQALSGLCIGLASLFRQQAGILLAALGLALVWRAVRDRQVRVALPLLSLAGGFLAPWVATAVIFAFSGALSPFWDWVVTRNLQHYPAGSPRDALLRAAQSIPLCVASAAVPWVLATRETLRPAFRSPARLGVVLALWMSWIAVSVGWRFYEHYFLQFIAPLALLASSGAASLVESWRTISRSRRVLVLTGCCLPALILLGFSLGRGVAGQYPEQEPRARELAAWLARNTAPGERLFIWGHYSPIYYLSGRLPGTRYVTTSVHVGNFDPGHLADGVDLAPYRSDRDVAFTIADLERNRVPVFVDTTRSGIHHWDRIPLSVVPALEQYLRGHYKLTADVGGSLVYRRQGMTAARP